MFRVLRSWSQRFYQEVNCLHCSKNGLIVRGKGLLITLLKVMAKKLLLCGLLVFCTLQMAGQCRFAKVRTATHHRAVLLGFTADFASHLAFSELKPLKFLKPRLAETFSRFFVLKNKYDVFAVSESWLNSSVTNAEVSLKGYKIFQLDRKQSRWRCLRLYS